MPGYKSHIVGGVAAFAFVFYFAQSQCDSSSAAAQWLGCTLAGALFPDIDVKSKGQKYFYWIVLALLIALLAMQKYDLFAVCGIASVTPMLCNHRGIFHEPWFVIALPASFWIAASAAYPEISKQFFFFALFFILGAFSHLYLDRGWRGIWPKKKFKKF